MHLQKIRLQFKNNVLQQSHHQQRHFCYSSVLLKKEVFNQVGLFNAMLILLLDFDMWVRILIHGFHLKILPEKLTNFRVLNDNANLGGAGEKSTIRIALEMKQILLNYTKIVNYTDFLQIFPNYVVKNGQNLALPGYFYLLDYCWQQYFAVDRLKSYIKNHNIKNFILEFVQFQSFVDRDFYISLQQNCGLTFADYLKMSTQYPNGILLYNKKKLSKKLAKSAVLALIILVLLAITMLFSW